MSSQDNIKSYLLGELDPEQQQEIEERFLYDPDFFAEAETVEIELIDSYLNDSLSEKDNRNFVSHFLTTPQQVRRLRMAAAFRKYLSESTDLELQNTVNKSKSRSWLREFSWRVRAKLIHAE